MTAKSTLINQGPYRSRNSSEERPVPATVLVVEDDAVSQELVRLYLQKDGHKVIAASTGNEGLRLAQEARPDLVVLDLMLPGIDGLEICRRLRQESSVPIVMLTARVEEEDRLAGLDLGADDYITKPFSPRELAARVRAVLRRTDRESREGASKGMTYRGITLDQTNRKVEVNGKSISLTPTEFRLLAMFMREPGRAFTRDQIIDRSFGYDFDGFDRTVDAHVSNLRRKLGMDSESSHYIQAVYGVGYRFGRE
jgi:DNA-binding response OmpR family regulator